MRTFSLLGQPGWFGAAPSVTRKWFSPSCSMVAPSEPSGPSKLKSSTESGVGRGDVAPSPRHPAPATRQARQATAREGRARIDAGYPSSSDAGRHRAEGPADGPPAQPLHLPRDPRGVVAVAEAHVVRHLAEDVDAGGLRLEVDGQLRERHAVVVVVGPRIVERARQGFRPHLVTDGDAMASSTARAATAACRAAPSPAPCRLHARSIAHPGRSPARVAMARAGDSTMSHAETA